MELEFSGYGYGYGDGSGYGSGSGYGYGYGDGSGYGSGYGSGSGYGYGYGDGSGVTENEYLRRVFIYTTRNLWDITRIMTITNAEFRREAMEEIGLNNLFSDPVVEVVHRDMDKQGNGRRLLRLKCEDAQGGYLQAVEVVCPTTGRVYHLLVPHTVKTCHDAVASTFDVEDYDPIRES